jgi:hypothetical protein
MGRSFNVFVTPGQDVPLMLAACVLICRAIQEQQAASR